MIRLEPGEAYVWAAGNDKYLRPQAVRMRPRLTLHGGGTRRASTSATSTSAIRPIYVRRGGEGTGPKDSARASVAWTTDPKGCHPFRPSKFATKVTVCAWARTPRLKVMAAHTSARVSKVLEQFIRITSKGSQGAQDRTDHKPQIATNPAFENAPTEPGKIRTHHEACN